MKIEQAELRQPWRNDDVWRIAGEPRARDAVLDDVEGFHHHARNAGPCVGASEKLALEKLAHGADAVGGWALGWRLVRLFLGGHQVDLRHHGAVAAGIGID